MDDDEEYQHHYHHHDESQINQKPTYQVYCQADYNYALTIRDGIVILAPSNPSDPRQHWYKDDKFKTRVKDDLGLPSFALVNKATGQAIRHSVPASQPLQLTDQYDPEGGLDRSILFSEASIWEDANYKAIRMVDNTRLNMDAFKGVEKCGGVRDGTIVCLWEWNGGRNQRWKIIPY